jgi:ComF family protein
MPYEGLGGVLVRAGKYGHRSRLLTEICRHAAESVAKEMASVDLVVAVPSPSTRVIARGFSSTGILAFEASRLLGVPCARILARRPGPKQAGLSRQARKANVEKAFYIRQPPPPGSTILLVDDVLTTGSTANACALELLAAGADAVHLFVLASAAP